MASGRGQTFVTILVIAVLAAIAGVLAIAAGRYDPDEFALGRSVQAQASARATAGPAEEAAAPACAPPGMAADGGPKTYGPDSLADRIDGRADLYLSAGFRSLRCSRFSAQDTPGHLVDVCEYDMGSPVAARHVYLAQLRPGSRALPLGGFAAAADGGVFLVVGSRYVEMVSSEVTDDLASAMEALAVCLVSRDAAGDEG